MDKDSKFTIDEEGYTAVRVVTAAAGTNSADKDYMFTRDADGYIAVRVVNGAGSGGDQSNLGYFTTLQALQEAYPTAEPGNWAIVGATDTVWVWDEDTSAWVDTDQKGQVTSVNNQTGAVTVQETLVSGTNIKTIDGNSVLGSGNLELSTYLTYPAGWPTTGTTKAFCDTIAADTTAVAGKAYLGEVTLSDLPASMANAEIVVEIMSGTTASNKVIKLTCSSGNTEPYLWIYTYWNNGTNVSGWKGFQPELPSQTGQSGKYLTTNGTDASWSDKPLTNQATGTNSLVLLNSNGWYGGNNIVSISSTPPGNSGEGSVSIGYMSFVGVNGNYGIAIGTEAQVFVGSSRGIAIGLQTEVYATGAIQIGSTGTRTQNLDANTFKVGNANGNFEMMSADGTIPTDRFTTTPSADGTYTPTVTISSGVATRSWAPAASAPVVPSTMPTLAVADWSSNTQTVNVTGVTASNVVFVSPAPASASDYAAAGIVCTAQGAGTLTFTCTTVPSNAITVNVVILG